MENTIGQLVITRGEILYDLNILKNHLFEEYEISFGKKIRQLVRNGTTDKEKICHFLALRNLFLLRRLADPGFDSYVNELLLKDDRLIEDTKNTIRLLCRRGKDDINFDFDGLDGSLSQQPDVQYIGPPPSNPFNPIDLQRIQNGQLLEESSRYTINYLKERRIEALGNKDLDELMAIEWSLLDENTNLDHQYILFSDDDFFKGLPYPFNWSLRARAFLNTHIRLIDLHTLRNVHYCPAQYITVERMRLERIFIDFLKEFDVDFTPESEDSLEWCRAVGHAISIAAVKWFDKLPESCKIESLNRTYPIEVKLLNQCIFDDKEKCHRFLSYQIGYLGRLGYCEDSINLANELLNDAIGIDLRYCCHDNIATSFRELGSPERALIHYQKSLQIAESLGNSYQIAISLKNIFEISNMLGDYECSKASFSRLEEVMKLLSKVEEGFLLWNLACANKRLGYYQEEMRYLIKILKNSEYDEKTLMLADERLAFLNSPSFNNMDFSLNYDALDKYEKDRTLDDCIDKAEEALLSFQFRPNRTRLARAMLLSDDPEIYRRYAESFYLEGDFHAFKNEISKVPEEHPYYKRAKCLLGITSLIEGNEEDGIASLKQLMGDAIHTRVDAEGVFNFLIKEIVHNNQTHYLGQIVGGLEGCIETTEEKFILYYLVGKSLASMGLYDLSKENYIKAMAYTSNNVQRGGVLYGLAIINQDIGFDELSERMFIESLEFLPDNYNAYLGLAQIYARRGDIIKAIHHINKAIEINPDNIEFVRQRNLLENRRKTILNIKSVKSNDAINCLEMAENLLLNPVFYIEGDADYSLAILSYGKAAELMLNCAIADELREPILSEFGWDIKEEYWKGSGTIEPLPKGLRAILGHERRSVSIGEWSILLKNKKQYKTNPVICEFRNRLELLYDLEHINVIIDACDKIASFRNPAAHYKTMTREEALDIRTILVSNLNKIISVLYD